MKILICDNMCEAKHCKDMLEQYAKKHLIETEIDIVLTEEQLLFQVDSKNTDIDLIFLEWFLPKGMGIRCAKKLRQKEVKSDIVFYTNDMEHASCGYDVEALSYIIKNNENGKIEEIFLKAAKRAEKRHEEMLSLCCAGEKTNIEISSIAYFEISKRIITVHYGREETFEFYSTLSKVEKLLEGKGFIRIHQSYLVAEKYITRQTKQNVVIKNNVTLPVGRSFRKKM